MHILGSAVRRLCLSWIVGVKRLLVLVSIMELKARGPVKVVILISFLSALAPDKENF
jgi:uncharacterized MnhB-related membrane protein